MNDIIHFLRSLQDEVWIGVAGAMLVLFQSLVSGTRRAWYRLVASCLIGGSAAALTGHIFADSTLVYAYCGVAAIMAENIIFGLFNASERFKDDPINVFSQIWRVVMPSFGRGTDKAGVDDFGAKTPPAAG